MLSYRHAFHAGNHADVLKHLTLYAILRYYQQKALPFVYLDTHAGAGLYDLRAASAQKTGEAKEGILRLKTAVNASSPLMLQDFLALWQSACPAEHYWGSPFLAAQCLHPESKMRLFELHPQDAVLLRETMNAFRLGRACKIVQADGLQGLIANLPPTPRRAVILIDPSYELKQEYQELIKTLQAAQKRFETGCYAIWYPLLNHAEMLHFARTLPQVFAQRFVHVTLQVRQPAPDALGMYGSGMFIINPPYTLARDLEALLPDLTRILAQDRSASFSLKVQD